MERFEKKNMKIEAAVSQSLEKFSRLDIEFTTSNQFQTMYQLDVQWKQQKMKKEEKTTTQR